MSIALSRWARPRDRRGCCNALAARTTGWTSRAKAILVPGNRFEYLEAQAAFDAVTEGVRDGEAFQVGSYDVLAQHVMGIACAGPFDEAELLAEVQSALPYSALDAATFKRVIEFIATGGYSLKAYDKFKKLVKRPDGKWYLSHPEVRGAAPLQRGHHRRFTDARRSLSQRAQIGQG